MTRYLVTPGPQWAGNMEGSGQGLGSHQPTLPCKEGSHSWVSDSHSWVKSLPRGPCPGARCIYGPGGQRGGGALGVTCDTCEWAEVPAAGRAYEPGVQ